jgi:isopentenyl phosphate kinase
MIPKIDACFRASDVGAVSHVSNGKLAGTVQRLVAGEALGTRIGG